jgi:hypothetical protein
VANTRWWPPFCLVVDWVAAAILVVLLALGVDFHSLAGQQFPNPEALLRLAGAVPVEAHDDWQVSDRGYLRA